MYICICMHGYVYKYTDMSMYIYRRKRYVHVYIERTEREAISKDDISAEWIEREKRVSTLCMHARITDMF